MALGENRRREELGKCCILFIEIYVNLYFSFAFLSGLHGVSLITENSHIFEFIFRV